MHAEATSNSDRPVSLARTRRPYSGALAAHVVEHELRGSNMVEKRPARSEGRFTVKLLCCLLLLQGYPLSALQESGVRLRPRLRLVGVAEGWADRLLPAGLSASLAPIAAWGDARVPFERLLIDGPQALLSWLTAAHASSEVGAVGARGHAASQSPPSPPKFREPAGDLPPIPVQLPDKSALEEIPFAPGWNLLSIPEEPADTSPAAVLEAVGRAYTHAIAYDACDAADPWKLYDPADPAASDLTAIETTLGFWIEATLPVDLPSQGTLPPSTSIRLCAGWNLIGFPAAQARPVRNALASIEGKYLRVFGYKAFAAEDPWDGFDVSFPEWGNDLKILQPGRGYWVLVTEDVTLEIANEGPAPTVALSVPEDLDVVTSPTQVIGTVTSPTLERWTLSYRAIGEDQWIGIASDVVPLTEATLGVFDPTLLLNGLYDFRLEASDYEGRTVEETIAVAVEGNMKIGHFTLSFVDLAMPVSGLDLEVIRTYDTRDLVERDFGVGWALDLRQGSYRNNRPPGEGWQLAEGFLPCDSTLETRSHLTVIRLSESEVYRFALRVVDGAPSIGGGCFATARFDYVDGPIPGATLTILGNDRVFQETESSDRVLDVDNFDTFEPQGVRLSTRDGRVFDLDLDFGVTRVEDPNGNQLEIREEGIFHSAGKAVEFERDAEARITKITDPAGHEIAYDYDAAGDLVRTIDPEANATTFAYDADHRLVDIIDARDVRAVRSEYDADGRLVKVTDALGNDLRLEHDLDGRREVVTNRLGFARVLEYDVRGNVVRETDELGKITTRTYDAKDRLLTETDPLANTTTFVYDADGDLTSVTDPLGNATTFTYDALGNPLTITDPRGKVTRNSYDERGNLISTTDPLEAVTAFTYDARGQLLTETDAAGNVTAFAYNASGNQILTTDALGTETTLTYDANGNATSQSTSRTLPDESTETLTTTLTVDGLGRVTSTTWPDGSTTRTSYDPLGALLSTTDALGRLTSFRYDAAGRQTETVHADGTNDLRDYDAEGLLVAVTDRAGRVTTFSYDASGRLVTTEYPDGATTSSAFDDAGRLVASTDARGSTTTYVYDAAARRTQVIDALGNTTTFAYDATGNQTMVTDALGNRTSFTYDDAGRLLITTLPDGTTVSNEYDTLGRRVAETDQTGRVTHFGYDPLGGLVQVTDAMGGITRYTYDEIGNRISQTDANGNTTRFTYDEIGRQTSRVLPDGAIETFAYDAVGNRIRRTGFNGVTTTYTYDGMDRLTRRSYPDGISVSFNYTATGRRATVTDSRGVTTYAYDERDRLVVMTAPEGWVLRYAWDAAGNRTALTGDLGDQGVHTTAYSYDALGRMTTVTDSRGGLYSYGYDAGGRFISLSYPNGVVTTYAHDAVGRLVDLNTEAPDGTVIQDYAYTLGPTGNRQAVTEQDGTVRAWEYDDLLRLTRELVTDGNGALVYESSFTYDLVGNRTRQVRTAADGPTETTTYAYDGRDRLLTEMAVDGSVTTYGWDVNGNLVAKIDSEGSTTYEWDIENRLLSVELPGGTVRENSYDADGVRLTSTLTLGSGGPMPSINYVSDTSGPLSQVIAEMTTAGVLETVYPRGLQLLGLLRTEEQRYVHSDHLGSVRALTEPTASITDSFNYEAFGTRLDPVAGHESPFLFAGEQRDPATGLYYLRARWMDPEVGWFASLDPFAGAAREPLSLHKYVYASADPVNRSDPSGYSPGFQVAVVALAVASVALLATTFYLNSGHLRALSTQRANIRRVVVVNDTWEDAEAISHLHFTRQVFQRFGIALNWSSIEHYDFNKSPGEHWNGDDFDNLVRELGIQGAAVTAFIGSPYFPDDGGPEHEGLTYHRHWAGGRFVSTVAAGTSPRWTAHETAHLLGELSSHVYPPGNLMSFWGTDLDDNQVRILREHLAQHPFK